MNLKKIFFPLLYLVIAHTHVLLGQTINSISPPAGPTAGGNVVTITGVNFNSEGKIPTSITFGSFGTVPPTAFTDTTITANAPQASAGTVDVIVNFNNGSQTAVTTNDRYTYQGDWFAYIALADSKGDGSILPINLASNTTSTPIPYIASTLDGISVTPNGKVVYVTDSGNSNVNLITVASNSPLTTINAITQAFDISIPSSTNGVIAYVTNPSAAQVTPIPTTTNIPGVAYNGGPGASFLATTPNGKTAFVINSGNMITMIDLETYATSTIDLNAITPTPIIPIAIAITPNTKKAYVVFAVTNNVGVIDLTTSPPTVNPNPIPVGSFPNDIAITANGEKVVITNFASSDVTILSALNDSLLQTVSVGSNPNFVAITPDSRKAIITCNNPNQVIGIDLSNFTTTDPLPIVLGIPGAIAITPDQSPVAYFTATPAQARKITVFDASNSLSPTGSIVNYLWNFGDGTVFSTALPVVTHIYAQPGFYNVLLTVTNSAGTSATQTFTGQTMSNNGDPLLASSSQPVVISALISPPRHLCGKQCKEIFAIQTDIFNTIKWKAPNTGNPPVGYRIYRDVNLTKLIGVVSARQPLVFEDHNRKKNRAYEYFIVSVDEFKNVSEPASIIVYPRNLSSSEIDLLER